MKKILLPLVAMMVIVFMNSCQTSKQVPYMQNIDSLDLSASKGLFDARIMPKDQLTITVHTSDPVVSHPFNLTVSRTLTSDGGLSAGGGSLQGYLVDNEGYINFPIVGRIHVQGLTKRECEKTIEEKIAPYLAKSEKPVVTVRMSSFRITLIGDFSSPKVVPVTTEKMSILEALASGGDLTLYGKRENVMLIREDATGKKSVHRIDLTDANFINSPYYYLQQNDVVYVEPKKSEARNAFFSSSTSILFSITSMITSLATFILAITK